MIELNGRLEGRRILIVEDEYYLADDLAAAVRGAGGEVVGPVGTLVQAEETVALGGFDGAILDMNLRGDFAFPIAARLEREGIPFVVATGYNSASLPTELDRHPRIEKLFDQWQVVEAVARLFAPVPSR